MDEDATLFRPQVYEAQRTRLYGDVNVVPPLSWQFITFALVGILALATAFLASTPYAQIVTVEGVVVPEKGYSTIVAGQAGVVSALNVEEGDAVRKGKVLLNINTGQNESTGQPAQKTIQQILEANRRNVSSQIASQDLSARAEAERAQARVSGLSAEMAGLRQQLGYQRQIVEAAKKDFDMVASIAKSGFVSQRDIRSRESNLLAQQQQMAQLDQTLRAKMAEARDANANVLQIRADSKVRLLALSSSESSVSRDLAEASKAAGYALTAPSDGLVTAVAVRPGQRVELGMELLSVVPRSSTSVFELYVPTSRIGRIAENQSVSITLDAYPYQVFGTIKARVTRVALAPTSLRAANGMQTVYIVRARMTSQGASSKLGKTKLRAGMSIAARIATDRTTLFAWIIRPLQAAWNV